MVFLWTLYLVCERFTAKTKGFNGCKKKMVSLCYANIRDFERCYYTVLGYYYYGKYLTRLKDLFGM